MELENIKSKVMKFPAYLKPNDTIGIVCPSGYLPIENAITAKETFEEWGFKVRMGKTVGSEYFYFSQNDEKRLEDLQQQLDDPEIKAIVMGRGGYGLSRIIDRIDFTKFIENPKWICGFSDITILLSHIQQQFQIACLHAPMCNAFNKKSENQDHLLSLKKAFQGIPYSFPVKENSYNKPGKTSGILSGGNLAILAHLTGSVSQVNMQGKILFIEDVGEYLYNIDRMLNQLKRNGVFKDISGLICGGFSDLKDTVRPFGQGIHEIILEKVIEFDFPVCFDFPAGHIDVNYTLKFGLKYDFQVTDHSVSFTAS